MWTRIKRTDPVRPGEVAYLYSQESLDLDGMFMVNPSEGEAEVTRRSSKDPTGIWGKKAAAKILIRAQDGKALPDETTFAIG